MEGGTVETYNITGTLDSTWMNNNGYRDVSDGSWLKTITQADIGNTVTSIGNETFNYCFMSGTDATLTIPDTVTSIGENAFGGSHNLTSVTIVANGGNANNVKQMLISAGVDSSITWNMPS